MYAHTRIHDWRTDTTYEPGDEVPDDLPGIEELIEYSECVGFGHKTVSKEPWAEPGSPTPPLVYLGGATYIRSDEITRKLADAQARYARDEITVEELDEIIGDALGVKRVSGSDGGNGGEATA